MSRKLAKLTNNIILIVIAVAALAVIAAAIYYWNPANTTVDKAGPKTIVKRDVNLITIACKDEPDGLNPYDSLSIASAQLAHMLFSGLTAFDEKGNAVPDLAVSVPVFADGTVSPDGKIVTYRLRNDAGWSDGQAFTSADVVATWKYIINNKKVIRKDGYNQILAIDTPDPQTAVIRFRQYYPEYLTLFPVILPAHILGGNPEQLARKPVGTGPYKIKEWLLGDSLLLEANDGYFAGKPKIAGVKVRFINEDKILLAQLKAGELDLSADIDLQQYDVIREIRNYETRTEPTLELERLDFNCADQLLLTAKIRTALALAVDKKHICGDLLSGAAMQTASFVLPLSAMYNPDIAEKKDIQAAQAMLAAEGWQTGADGVMVKSKQKLRIELLVDGDNIRRAVIAENIASGFREAGADTVITKVPDKEFMSRLKTGKYQVALYGIMMYPDYSPNLLWNSAAIPSAANGYSGMNYPRFKDPRIDKLLNESGLQPDKNAMLLLQRYLNQEMPSLPLYYRQAIAVQRKGLTGYSPGISVYGSYRNSQLWQWQQ